MSVHKAVIDKFSSAEGFAAFLQSPAGQKFVTDLSGSESPARAVIGAIQKGIILILLGGGLWWVGGCLRGCRRASGRYCAPKSDSEPVDRRQRSRSGSAGWDGCRDVRRGGPGGVSSSATRLTDRPRRSTAHRMRCPIRGDRKPTILAFRGANCERRVSVLGHRLGTFRVFSHILTAYSR
jgi:hypothetical protein